ncbi:MAG: amidohydrolase family protein [Thermoanaerobaculia bacterium]
MTPDQALSLGPDRDGMVLVAEAGRIARFDAEAPAGRVTAPLLDCTGARIEPGRVNAHTHIYSGLAPLGMPAPEAAPENFLQILQRVWWRLDRALDEESLRASARYYVAQALLAGTTTLVDHHESPNFVEGSLELLADACQELGMRALLCYGATERNGGREEAHRGLEECRRFHQDNGRPLVRGVVGLHASFTVSDQTIEEAAGLCRELDTVMHVHLAEDLADVEDAIERGYDGPLERLLHFGALPPGSVLAHCVHCQAAQVRTIAAKGLWIVQNPRSNRGNGVGYPAALGESGRVAVGTDGYPARMEDELRVLRAEAAEHGEAEALVDARAHGGHRLGADRFGLQLAPLTPGGAADFIVRDNDRVLHVGVAGRVVVRDGCLTTADLEEIHARAEEQAKRLWDRMSSV